MGNSNDVAAWFVVWTAARAERTVAQRLEAQGYRIWLPLSFEQRRWSDRLRMVEVPLFPGYLFVRQSEQGWHGVLRTSGVLTVVKSGSLPVWLDNDYISKLRAAISAKSAAPTAVVEPAPINSGDEVEVRDGVLMGLRGVVTEVRGNRRLSVWIAQIGRGVLFSLGRAQVAPVGRTVFT